MNTGKRIAALLLIFVLFCCTGLEAYAVTESQDGLSVTLTTDKQSYLPGEAINVSLLLTNGNSFPISSVHAQASAPEGYILAAGYAESMSTTSLGAGKSLQLAIRYLEQNSVPVPLPTPGPDRVGVATGDRANLALWIALAVVSLAALMLLALRKKIWKRFFCLLLCFVLLGGIAGPVYAANDQVQKTIRVATSVKVGNRDLTVQGVVSYTMGSEVSPSPAPTAVPSPTPTAQPSPTPAPSPSPTPSPVPGEYFTVSYQLNYEGAGEYLSQQVEKGSCAQEPSRPTREGHTFMGWYTEPGCVNRYIFSSPISGNTNLYARWSAIETLTDIVPSEADFYIDDDLYADFSDEKHIDFDPESGLQYYDNEIILMAVRGTTREQISQLVVKDSGKLVGYDIYTDSFLIRFPTPMLKEDLDELLASYEAESIIENVFLNLVQQFDLQYYPISDRWDESSWSEIPDGENWGLEAIKAPGAWEYRSEMQPVRVGIFDGGCDISHPELVTIIYDRALGEVENNKSISHGTHVAGIVGAKFDEEGICGVCPTSRIAVIDTTWARDNRESDFYWTTALSYLIGRNNSNVVNISLGYSGEIIYAASHGERTAQNEIKQYGEQISAKLEKLIEINPHFVICVAAGNENDDVFYRDISANYNYYAQCIDRTHNHKPNKEYYVNNNGKCTECTSEMLESKVVGGTLAYWGAPLTVVEDYEDYIIVVGACKNNGDGTFTYSNFSNVGGRVDVVAPGEDILSTVSNDGYESYQGTSMASPHVAGVAAMLYSLDPTLTGPEVKRIIVETAKTDVQGFNKNIVDAEAAVKSVVYRDSIMATITDGTTPLKDAYAVISYSSDGTAVNSTTQIVPAAENGFFYYKMPEGVEQMTLSFHCKGYYDYEYPEIVYADLFYDLGEIVLEAKLVPDTVEAMTYLKDADTGTAIAGAQIQAFSGSGEIPVAVATSDDAGYLCIELPENTLCKLKISCEGYNSRELDLQLKEPLWFGEKGTGLGEADAVLYLQKAGAFEGFAGGDGTANNPYQIATAAQMDAVRRNLTASYVLIDDIDLSTYSPWVPIGTETAPFTGSLNGDFHTISNLLINDTSRSLWIESNCEVPRQYCLGLFGFAEDAIFSGIYLSGVHTELNEPPEDARQAQFYGSICGLLSGEKEITVSFCNAEGSVTISHPNRSYAGGIIGSTRGTISNCANYVTLTIQDGQIICGGIIANLVGSITQSTNYGQIDCYNPDGPDILSGGIVGSASGCNISLCQNRGNIRSETKGWGWPTSANYRHQTGGIVGLFEGGFPAEKTKVIAACENYGNIEVISFTGYNIANSCCENDDTGGICGGFACLSSSKWYGEISNCINYATSIHAQRVKNVDGTLEYTDSPAVGRIGGHGTTSYYSYSNNASDPATLLNGAVCTENIGAETKNGANLGEEDNDDENGELNISILEGTWSNGLPEDNYSGFYLTEFGSDGTVVQKGYRNIDKGRFEITGANTAVATFDDNYYDTSGVGYQKIADYSYTVTYTYDKYSDTLLADYSDVFENAANSNACDGTLSRWSGTPLHEQIKDIVLGTQEDDTQEQEPQDYQSFLTSQAYLDYAEGWNSSGETYAILDINQDGVDELIVNSPNDFGFMYSLVFTKNYEGQIVRLANEYHYGYIRYSAEHSAIEYSELNPTPDLGSGEFYAMSGAGLALIFSISWDNSEGAENSQIYYPSSGESVPISAEERQEYFASLQNLNWVSLT